VKKLILAAALLMFTTGSSLGQALKKGDLVGIHTYSVKLSPGITMEQYADFCLSKAFPEMEKNFQGLKVYLGKRIRGESDKPEFDVTFIWVFASEKDRGKYFTDAGDATELGEAVNKRLEPIFAELEKMGSGTRDRYTDWLIY